jgi:hypothetical protein
MSTKSNFESSTNHGDELREWMAWRFAIVTFMLVVLVGAVAYFYGKGRQIRVQERAAANANQEVTTGALTPRQPDVGAPVTPSPNLPSPPPSPGR